MILMDIWRCPWLTIAAGAGGAAAAMAIAMAAAAAKYKHEHYFYRCASHLDSDCRGAFAGSRSTPRFLRGIRPRVSLFKELGSLKSRWVVAFNVASGWRTHATDRCVFDASRVRLSTVRCLNRSKTLGAPLGVGVLSLCSSTMYYWQMFLLPLHVRWFVLYRFVL